MEVEKQKNRGTISGPPFTASHYVFLFFISILDNLLHTYTRRHTRLSSWSGCKFSVAAGQLAVIFPVSGKHFKLCLLSAYTAARGGNRNLKQTKQINKKQNKRAYVTIHFYKSKNFNIKLQLDKAAESRGPLHNRKWTAAVHHFNIKDKKVSMVSPKFIGWMAHQFPTTEPKALSLTALLQRHLFL